MIDVSELMNDPDFATLYKVIRRKGKWEKGRFKIIENPPLVFYGPVQPASPDDLNLLPEGDREKGVMKFFCSPPNELYVTHEDGEEFEGISDIVEYKGIKYKIIQISNWRINGFNRAFGVRMGG